MQALAEGDDNALNEIMNRWHKPIVSFLYKTIGDYDTSLDLAQEVFVRLYKNRLKYTSGKKFSSYIFTIAVNLAKNHFRWKSRHPEASIGDCEEVAIASSLNPQCELEKDEEARTVRLAVLSLPEKLRIPVTLFYFEELSHKEIADVMQSTSKSVEARLYRARKLLKLELEKGASVETRD